MTRRKKSKPSTQDPPDANAVYERALVLMEQEKIQDAIDEFDQAIALDADFGSAYLQRGLAYKKQGEIEKSIEDFTRAIDVLSEEADLANAYYHRSIARANIGELSESYADLDKAMALNPQLATGYSILGVSKRDADKAVEPEIEHKPAFVVDPGEVAVGTSEDLAQQEAARQAEEELPRALEAEQTRPAADESMQPRNDSAKSPVKSAPETAGRARSGVAKDYFNQGLAHLHESAYEQATAKFDQAISLDANFTAAFFQRGIAHHEAGNLEAAISDYNQAISLDRKYAAAYFNRGNAQYELGELVQAIASYSAAISYFVDETDRADAYYNRALAHFERRELDKAISDNDKAIRSFKDNSDRAKAYNNRGLANFGKGNYKEAISDYTHAIHHAADGPVLPILYRNRANALIEARHLDEALSDCQTALVIEPRNPDTFVRLGKIYYRLANYEKAIKSYENAEKYLGSPTTFNLEIALSKLCLEQTGAALGHIRNTLSKGPERGYLETILDDYRELKEKQPDLPGLDKAIRMVHEALEGHSDDSAV